MNKVYLLIGGNVGDRQGNLEQARREIALCIGEISRTSSVYETAPWGNQAQDSFLNQVLEVLSPMDPDAVLETTLAIEQRMGRIRQGLNQPRTIDIDILYFNNETISRDGLTIPHPRIAERKFVLIPMNELNPDWVDPAHKQSIIQLLGACRDELEVNKLDSM
jgi:2-amino-4-hydroxy-6-hydroxymethyldihydropteridine diphosphokinase